MGTMSVMDSDMRAEVTALAINVTTPEALRWTDTRRGQTFTLTTLNVRLLADGHLAVKAYGRPADGGPRRLCLVSCAAEPHAGRSHRRGRHPRWLPLGRPPRAPLIAPPVQRVSRLVSIWGTPVRRVSAGAPLGPPAPMPQGGTMAHPVVHAEIRSNDPDATRKFFGDLLGWTYPSEGAVPGYTFVDTGVPDALYTAISPLQGGSDLVTFFVGVDDIHMSSSRPPSSAARWCKNRGRRRE